MKKKRKYFYARGKMHSRHRRKEILWLMKEKEQNFEDEKEEPWIANHVQEKKAKES